MEEAKAIVKATQRKGATLYHKEGHTFALRE